MIDRYDWAGGREAMLRFGPDDGPVVVVAMPLLEEANRTRTLVVRVLRLLAGHGIASRLPDLPGTGESDTDLVDVTYGDWLDAFAAAAGTAALTFAIRGGALIDSAARPRARYLLSPVSGADQFKAWRRIAGFAAVRDELPGIAGNNVSSALWNAIQTADWNDAAPSRLIRLGEERGMADHRIAALAPWRRTEPAEDAALAAALADDLANWVTACDGI